MMNYEILYPSNVTARILKAIALVTYVLAFMVGCFAGYSLSYDGEFVFSVALTIWIIGFIQGTFIFGFSEVIRLLDEINLKCLKIAQK